MLTILSSSVLLAACTRDFEFGAGESSRITPIVEDGPFGSQGRAGISAQVDGYRIRLISGNDLISPRAVAWGRGSTLTSAPSTLPGAAVCRSAAVPPKDPCEPRLEFQTHGFTEWWVRTAEGYQQGWTVDRAPAGMGELTVEVDLEGGEVRVAEGGLQVDGEAGEVFNVSGLAAWDANGTALNARFALTAGGFSVLVDDRGAQYPVQIDPVYSTPGATLAGDGSSLLFGWSVSEAGDVNGDGYGDVVVGASPAYFNTLGIGQAVLFEGTAAGTTATPAVTLSTGSTTDAFGFSVAAAGDVNGDGFDDVLVGAYWADQVFLYLGSGSGLSAVAATKLEGSASSGYFGYTMAGAGDVNGDGYDDVIVGDFTEDEAYIYLGSAAGLAATAATTLDGDGNQDFGYSVSGAGDVNGDGFDDVIVSTTTCDGSEAAAYVYKGSALGVALTPFAAILGLDDPGNYCMILAAAAGDINGDGYDDVLAGSMYVDANGRVDAYHGSATGISFATTLTGASDQDWFGASLRGAGDVNGDSFADVIVGAPGYAGFTGRTYVYQGGVFGLATTATTVLDAPAPASFFGQSTSSAGDVNADGYADVIVGSPFYNSSVGQALVFEGFDDTDWDGDGYNATIDCDDHDATVNPYGDEVCDSANADEDCDSLADDADASAVGQTLLYPDGDGDGYGTFDGVISACDAPPGYAVEAGDCNDTDGFVHPDADEVCDLLDNDCDEVIDGSNATDRGTWYADEDGDGYTDSDSSMDACEAPSGYAAQSSEADCDDTDEAIHPSAIDTPGDGLDQDCDGADAVDVEAGDNESPGAATAGGCACATTASPTGWYLGLLALMVGANRRRRSPW